MEWELIKSERGPDLSLFQSRYDYKRNPRNGKTVRVLVLESPDSVNVAAVTSNKELLLIEQLRFGTDEMTLELPGGLLNEGETPLNAAMRELREETGYAAGQYESLGSVSSNPVFMDNKLHHFFAEQVSNDHVQELDDAESIQPILYPVEKVRSMLIDGKFSHPHTISGLVRFFYFWDSKRS